MFNVYLHFFYHHYFITVRCQLVYTLTVACIMERVSLCTIIFCSTFCFILLLSEHYIFICSPELIVQSILHYQWGFVVVTAAVVVAIVVVIVDPNRVNHLIIINSEYFTENFMRKWISDKNISDLLTKTTQTTTKFLLYFYLLFLIPIKSFISLTFIFCSVTLFL